MIPRSAAGRAIVKEVDTGVKETVEQSKERFIVLKKKSRDALLGVRFGVHPTTSQGTICHRPVRPSDRRHDMSPKLAQRAQLDRGRRVSACAQSSSRRSFQVIRQWRVASSSWAMCC